jgi:drug/metabolite transporter (DMT)-like permease
MFDMESVDSYGNTRKFAKPLMVTFIMFLAMMVALPLHFVIHYATKPASEPCPTLSAKMAFILIAPAITDLLGTSCAMIGLLYVKVSVYQLIRASTILFVAVYRVFLLKQKFHGYNWLGVFLNFLAILIVGGSAFFDPTAGSDVPKGIAILLLGCAIMASQLVLEEKVMSGDNTPPLIVVGMEGLWGTLIMLLIMFPIAKNMPGADNGCYEDFFDAIVMIQNNSSLLLFTVLYLLSITGYNVCAIFITFLLESVWRSILENFRPIAIWGTDLVLFYFITKGTFGEEWTPWCWLEMGGMFLLLIGTAVYNGSLKVPGFYYPDSVGDDNDDGEQQVPMTPTMERIMNSPLIQKSPYRGVKGAGITGTPDIGKKLPKWGIKGYGSTGSKNKGGYNAVSQEAP